MPYKVLSYQVGQAARAGVLVGDTVYDAAKVTGLSAHSSVLGVLDDWSRAKRLLAQAAKRIESGKGRVKGVPRKRARLLAPVLYPGNIYCAGANYTDHMAEMARAQGQAPGPTMKELGEKPWHFVKSSRSSIVGPGARVKLPVYSQMVDWQGRARRAGGEGARLRRRLHDRRRPVGARRDEARQEPGNVPVPLRLAQPEVLRRLLPARAVDRARR